MKNIAWRSRLLILTKVKGIGFLQAKFYPRSSQFSPTDWGEKKRKEKKKKKKKDEDFVIKHLTDFIFDSESSSVSDG